MENVYKLWFAQILKIGYRLNVYAGLTSNKWRPENESIKPFTSIDD